MRKSSPPNPLRPLDAFRALRGLVAHGGNRKELGLAFVRALEGNSVRRDFERFRSSPFGRTIIDERREFIFTLMRLTARNDLTPASLAGKYIEFIDRERVSLPGLLEFVASVPKREMCEEEWLFEKRLYAIHDVAHVVTGYGAEELGEVCLITFRCAQTWHLGFAFLILLSLFQFSRTYPLISLIQALREAFRRGREAVWLFGADWEALMELPFAEAQLQLGLGPAPAYNALRNRGYPETAGLKGAEMAHEEAAG